MTATAHFPVGSRPIKMSEIWTVNKWGEKNCLPLSADTVEKVFDRAAALANFLQPRSFLSCQCGLSANSMF